MQKDTAHRTRLKQWWGWLLFAAVIILLGLLLPLPSQQIEQAHCLPSLNNWLGCSPLGEDVLSLIFFGTFKTALVAISGRLLALLVSSLGFFLAYTITPMHSLITRLAEAFMAIPSLLLALAFGFFLGAGFFSIVTAVALSEWALNQKWQLGRLNEFKRLTFIQAADSFSASRWHKFKFHLVPFLKADSLVLFFVYFPTTILTVTSLEFLGLSSSDGLPGLGYQVAAYKDFIFLYPNLSLPPMIAVVLLVFASLRVKKLLDKEKN